MKVLFIENAGNVSAGAFHSMIALITLLKQYGVESYVAVPNNADGLSLLDENEIPYIKMKACSYTWVLSEKANFLEKFKMPIKYIYVRIASLKLSKFAKENKIDLVHENTSACYIGKFVSNTLNIPHIWHIREFLEEDFGMKIWNKKNALKMMNESTALITISDAITDKYKNLVRNNLIHKIYNGISVNQFYCKERQLNLSTSSKILCVGRVCEGKGQRDVIQAISLLKLKYNIEFQLYLAGIYDTEYAKEIMKPATEVGIEKNIHFLGQCNNMKKIYTEMDILCMSSKKEAFGRVTVEAMLSGTLVIGSNSGGTAEIITNNKTGLLFDSGNVNDLVKKLKFAIENADLMADVAKSGQEYAKEHFDANRNAKEIYELYQSILN